MKKVIRNYRKVKITVKVNVLDMVIVDYLGITKVYGSFQSWKEIEDDITDSIDNLLDLTPKTDKELIDALNKYALQESESYEEYKLNPEISKIIISNFIKNKL